MTVTDFLQPKVASVLAACLKEQGSCCTHDSVASSLNIDEVERMDKDLAKLANYLESHAPALSTEMKALPLGHPSTLPVC